MDFSDPYDAIAAATHACWCKRMLEDGWRAEDVRDDRAKIHDAIRPYDQLPEPSRARLRRQARFDRFEEALADAGEHALMPQEITAGDIYVGMRVRFADDDETGAVGRVVSWEVDADEAELLDSISVEWPDGEVGVYSPLEQELAPADEP
jgi:hypothetical protein